MAKFGKFLLSTAALVGTAATAYYVYKNKDRIFKRTDDEIEDITKSTEEDAEANKPHYVSLDDAPTNEFVENITNSVTETASNAFDAVKNTVEDVIGKVKDAVDNFTATSEEVVTAEAVEETVEESVEEFFDDEV